MAAFEEMYRRFASALLGFAHARLGSRHAAEDLVQELFLILWRNRRKWELTRSLNSYLFSALRNHIVSYRRSVQARGGQAQHLDGSDERVVAIPDTTGADDRVREHELADAIERAIGELPRRCRETFLLVRQQHLSYVEAAEVLGISVKGVEMNMVRALAALRNQLAPWRDRPD